MAKRKNIDLERERKRQLWIERTVQVTGFDSETVRQLLSTKRTQSFRISTLKDTDETDILNKLKSLGIKYESVNWAGKVGGHTCDEEAIAKLNHSELSDNGEVYVQNAASWLPVLALDPKPEEAILDVCAAPGGKASHIQAITHNLSLLTCNDNSKPRLLKLQQNMRRLGASAKYTLCDATRPSRRFEPESFDKILLDAPCSGEGMMALQNSKDFDSWSVAHIRRLSTLQKRILLESWKLLKPGGTLVYSTCTMAPEENESVVDFLLRKNSDARLEPLNFKLENRIPALPSWNSRDYQSDLSPCLRLMPGDLTEAFFVAKIIKD